MFCWPSGNPVMSRSERYIPPTIKELERMQHTREAARQFERDRLELFRIALKRRKKVELTEFVLRMAQDEMACAWLLEQELNMDKPVALLVHDVEAAIRVATRVDELRVNYNVYYDWRAYEAIQFGLSQLIEKDAIDEAKYLALTLMRAGSYQIECSDEGLMQEAIESCLRLVISALWEHPDARIWALEMLAHDRVGCLCERELREMAGQLDRRSQV
jgi:hypothetical protein